VTDTEEGAVQVSGMNTEAQEEEALTPQWCWSHLGEADGKCTGRMTGEEEEKEEKETSCERGLTW
jgi:hypothetical protein